MNYAVTEACRSCGSKDPIPLFSLGPQYVNDFVAPGSEKHGPVVPIELELCDRCTLVQAHNTAPQDFMYSRYYWYRSGVTKTMCDALRDIAWEAARRADLRPGDTVLDIGSNDGTLLRSYAVPGLHTVGVEPADNLQADGSVGVSCLIHDFWSYAAYRSRVPEKARAVTAIGMFYDLEDPNKFIGDVSRVMTEDGVFVAQLMCLRDMVDLADVGNLAHEHLEFYSLRSLQLLMKRHGLEIFDLERNKVNGRSTRLYCGHVGVHEKNTKKIVDALVDEVPLASPDFYRRFFDRLERNKQECTRFIRDAVGRGKRVWVYGASTKGNVILQYYGLDSSLITAAAERSPEKWGKVTIGTGIPIRSERDFRDAAPDYALVLPYAFIDEFCTREHDWLSNGGRFLVPLPEFREVGP